MRLVVGGYAQGKLHAVTHRLADDQYEIFDGILPDEEVTTKLEDDTIVIIYNLHRWVRERIKQNASPEEEIAEFVEKENNCIIISNETGNGIVPKDTFEREYRERTGKILVSLAEEADEVWRIICGIPQKIK